MRRDIQTEPTIKNRRPKDHRPKKAQSTKQNKIGDTAPVSPIFNCPKKRSDFWTNPKMFRKEHSLNYLSSPVKIVPRGTFFGELEESAGVAPVGAIWIFSSPRFAWLRKI
jgi:hypothetical protein